MSTTDPREWLKAAQERAGKATRGPWETNGEGVNTVWSGGSGWNGPIDDRELVAQCAANDAEFIATARTDHPTMAAMLQAVLDEHPGIMVCSSLHKAKDCPYCHEYCAGCDEPAPCPTVLAITNRLEG